MNITEAKNEIFRVVINYFKKTDKSQIPHTVCVVYYTHIISQMENIPERESLLLEISAILHDVGCPNSKKKFGNTLPHNQETEGALLVPVFLEKLITGKILTEKECEWIKTVVGSHHNHLSAQKFSFEIMADADMIVNNQEGYYDGKNFDIQKALYTESARKLYKI